MIDVFLLLGTNLGNRQLFLLEAVRLIIEQVGPVLKSSSVYETQSWGKTDEPDYLNQIVVLQNTLPAAEILTRVLDIEQQMGRKREVKWGARTIDIDVLFYGNEVINEPGLIIPHPQLHNRRFTLEPLAEIAPELVHPVLQLDILALKSALNDSLIVKKL